MSGQGSVAGVFLAPGPRPTPMEAVERSEAVAGRGLRGDRYFEAEGTYSTREDLDPAADVTLIESEALEAAATDYGIDLDPGEHRRNLTTRGVPLNHLVGERFRAGEATLRGIDLCEPCAPLASVTGESDLVEALVHRGGLNANVVESGSVGVGDTVEF
jgi:hypothetical protein